MKKWFAVLLLMAFGGMCSACGMRITFDAQSSQPSVPETDQQPTLAQSTLTETTSLTPVFTDISIPTATLIATPTLTPAPTATLHIHSYTKEVVSPTCQKKGFTIYTCKTCGDSYKDHYIEVVPHKFSNHICTMCGKGDAYNDLKDWIFTNGTTKGDAVRFYDDHDDIQTRFSLVWDESLKEIQVINYYYGYEDIPASCVLFIRDVTSDNYAWGYNTSGELEVTMIGKIQPSRFSSKMPITYDYYEGDKSACDNLLEMARLMLDDSLKWFSWLLDRYNIGLTLEDFGFLAR